MELKGKRNSSYIRIALSLFGAAALSILLFFVIYRFDHVKAAANGLIRILKPFIYGAVIAYLLKPVCNYWERTLTTFFEKHWKKGIKLAGPLSVLISVLFGLILICVLLILVVPELLNSISSLLKAIPQSVNAMEAWVLHYVGSNTVLSNYVEELSESVSVSLPNWIRTNLLPQLQTVIDGFSSSVSGILTIFKNLFIGIIVAVYLLAGRKQFARQGKMVLNSIFSRRWSDIILSEIKYTDQMFSGFINGKIVDSLIIGVICFIGMILLRLPYPLLISVIVGVTNIIPFFGPYLGAVPSALLVLMSSPVKCLVFLIFILILQQIDGNIIGPRILGNVTGLSSFWVLFSILLFGGLFGFIGMIIGVPVFAVIYDIIRKLVRKGLARHQEL